MGVVWCRADVPLVIRAYLEGEMGVLREHCAPEMLERLSGLIRAQQAQARPYWTGQGWGAGPVTRHVQLHLIAS